jgi:hypothetical protein
MRDILAMVLAAAAAAAPAAAEEPSPTIPGAPPPPITVPERPPDATQGAPKPDLAPKPAPKPEEPIRPNVRTVSGEIGEVAWGEHRFTLEAADGPIAVHVDRNTLVFLESRLGTVRDLHTGMPLRVGLEGPRNLATWVEVRPQGTTAGTSKPDQQGPTVGTPGGTASGSSGAPGREPPTPRPPSSAPPGSAPGPGPVGPR